MEIFPAIDLRSGQVVRLRQGDYDRMDVYAADPAAVAERFCAEGAQNLHLVDLDGAKDGAPANFDAVRRVCALGGLFVEVGGGIRDEARVAEYLALGAGRVILGTAAVNDPAFLDEMLRKYGARIAVGVDARGGKVAISGWLNTTELDALEFCAQLRARGVQTVIYTDISRDGELGGSNLEVYRRLRHISGLDVVASGGVSSEAEIAALRDMGNYAAIIGRALYEGRLELGRAIAVAAGKERA